jgi:hypothetical protein
LVHRDKRMVYPTFKRSPSKKMGAISVMTALLVGMIITLAPIAAGNAFGLGKHTGFGHGVNVRQPAFIHKTKI